MSEETAKFILAAWGAFLSTLLALIKIRGSRRQIRVTGYPSFSLDMPEGRFSLAIYALNLGERPVRIVDAGLFMSNGDRLGHLGLPLKGTIQRLSHDDSSPLPKKLDRDDEVEVIIDYVAINNGLRNRPGIIYTDIFVEDVLGKVYKAKVPKLMIERGLAKRKWYRSFNRR